MKLTKIVLAAAALTAALVLAGCKTDEDPENAIASNGVIKYTNDGSADYYRSFVSTSTKHESSSAKLTIYNPLEVVDATFSKGDKPVAVAAVGYVFGIEKVSELSGKKYCIGEVYDAKEARKVDFYNFGIVSVRYNKNTSKVQWYVSWVENCPDVVFGYNNSSNFSETLSTEEGFEVYGTETQIVPEVDSYWENTTGGLNADNELIVNVHTQADTDGSYNIILLAEDDETPIASMQNIPQSVTGLTKPTQFKVGRYVTVYKDQSVNAKVDYFDMKGNLLADDDVDIVLE